MRRSLFFFILPFLCSLAAAQEKFDVVIYGATPAGITAAVALAEQGYRSTIVEARSHVGGIMSSGLGGSDVCNTSKIGGLSRNFFRKIGEHYGKGLSWRFEPHVAAKVFQEMIAHPLISLEKESPLEKVEMKAGAIQALVTTTGKRFAGKFYIDASYEGDLLAAANVPYALGREGQDEYEESLAGFHLELGPEKHNWSLPLSRELREAFRLLPGFFEGKLPEPGTGDSKVQAYNYRLCVTTQPENRRPFPSPKKYVAEAYRPLAEFLKQNPDKRSNDIFTPIEIPRGKYDLNNGGPFSTNFLGASWNYAEASLEERWEIEEAHREYTLGLLHFLVNDPEVPEHVSEKIKTWGLCKDEFVENENWPPLLYVREGRRMKGEYVLSQHDLTRHRRKASSVAMGSCPIETHAIQRVALESGIVRNEGLKSMWVHPYQIPYESLLPKEKDAKNLLVPVAISATQIAYSSLRMEPVFMALGESAGIAAALALREQTSLHALDRSLLRRTLEEREQFIGTPPRERSPESEETE